MQSGLLCDRVHNRLSMCWQEAQLVKYGRRYAVVFPGNSGTDC